MVRNCWYRVNDYTYETYFRVYAGELNFSVIVLCMIYFLVIVLGMILLIFFFVNVWV